MRQAMLTNLSPSNLNLVLVVLLLSVLGCVCSNPNPTDKNSNGTADPNTATVASPSSTPTPTPKVTANTGATVGKQSCADVESDLAELEGEQAGVEEMLNATQDYSDEGTIKKGIYFNALKRKADLQLQHIALEKKLRTCGKKK